MPPKRQDDKNKQSRTQNQTALSNDFVLDKSIFSNVFDKDIRRIYIYKKCERLAKAIHLITPAFTTSPALRDRLDAIGVGLIDAAILSPTQARTSMSRELLALSSLLSVARTGGLLSEMNADLIIREAHTLLQEVASYEEPRLFMDDTPTLSELAKQASADRSQLMMVIQPHIQTQSAPKNTPVPSLYKGQSQGHISDIAPNSSRRAAILEILETKGALYIKDISLVIRDVSEKTIQRELQALIMQGVVQRRGERRWSQYSLIKPPSN